LIQAWLASLAEEPRGNDRSRNSSPSSKERLIPPLLFESGEGWRYGASIEWIHRLVERLIKLLLGQYIHENILNVLGMTSSMYAPHYRPDVSSRILQMVRRDGDRLVPVKSPLRRELVSSAPDMAILLADLIGHSSKLLFKENIENHNLHPRVQLFCIFETMMRIMLRWPGSRVT